MEMLNMEDGPLATLPESKIRPPKEVLDQVMEELRLARPLQESLHGILPVVVGD